MVMQTIYPFAAIVGQEQAKRAVLAALVNPRAGGLLIGGCKGSAKTLLVRSSSALLGKQQLINLPLNITEDMLFGSIDIEYAVSKGAKRFAPGLLSRANGNIIYIDEANLLRSELLTAVLDTAASGINCVERDGISYSEQLQFTVIGSMNPEEGTLPSHILDRFGMYVDVQGSKEISERVEIMHRILQFEQNPQSFCNTYAKETKDLKEQLEKAQELLAEVNITEAMMTLAAQMCAQAFCAGHRAEIYLLETARALAALAGRTYILPQDMDDAAQLVLVHRMRKPPEQQEEQQENTEQEPEEDNLENQDDESQDNDDDDCQLPPPPSNEDEDNGQDDDDDDNEREDEDNPPDENQLAPEERIADIDKHFKMPKMLLDLGKNRAIRRGSGKRSTTRTDYKQGRYVRAELPKGKVEDLAFDATIRAAAPMQKLREDNGCALNIKSEDMRQKVREKRIGNTFLFAVDASGSMGARERMRAVKGAIFYMLQEAYQKRDRVGMIAFRRQAAELLLPITRSVDMAQKCLAQMPTGGKTPLADGLSKALLTLSLLNKRDKEMEPVLILLTDGRANAVAEGDDPIASALKMAEKIREAKITALVIDTESGFIKLGLAKKIAAAMGASYYTLQNLSKDDIIHIVKNIDF